MKKIAIVNPKGKFWATRIGIADPQAVVLRLPYNFPVLLARVLVEQADWEEVVVMVSQVAETPEEFAVLLMHAYQQYIAKAGNPLAYMEAQMMLAAIERGEFTETEQQEVHAQAATELGARRFTDQQNPEMN